MRGTPDLEVARVVSRAFLVGDLIRLYTSCGGEFARLCEIPPYVSIFVSRSCFLVSSAIRDFYSFFLSF